MKYKLLSLLVILFISFTSCQQRYAADDFDLVINNVKLFDGDSIFENVTVLVHGDSIAKILKDQTDFQGDNVIEGKGMTLIPGLINAHVHCRTVDQLKEAASAGVLTVLNLFNPKPILMDSLKILSFQREDLAYLFWAGPSVTVAEGHGTQYAPVPVIDNVSEIPNFIDNRIAENADFIKVIVESGIPKRRIRPSLSDEQLKVALSYIKSKNQISVVHISNLNDALKVADYGGNGLAHIWWKNQEEISAEQILKLTDNQVFIIPTLLLRSLQEKGFRQAGYDDLHINIDQLKNDILKLSQNGVPILAGTDPPNRGINFGTDLYEELYLLSESGLTPTETLKSATSAPSREFRLGEKGFIKEGYKADFVLIDGDPTNNIKDIAKIHSIWKLGKQLTPYNKR